MKGIRSCVTLMALLAASALHGMAQKPAEKAAVPASAAMSFEDVTKAAGIDFQLTCGGAEKRYIMEAMCGGVAFFDYDNDGWTDIFLLNGSTLEQQRAGKAPGSKLYRNNHDGTFRDVTPKAGLRHTGWGYGVAAGDYDNDGNEVLYLTYLDHALVSRNNGNG